VKEKPTDLYSSGRFVLTASLRRRRTSMYISLFTAAVPVSDTNKFREIFELVRSTVYSAYKSTITAHLKGRVLEVQVRVICQITRTYETAEWMKGTSTANRISGRILT
jgi:hypothetical protein